jgi:hypothetical protein
MDLIKPYRAMTARLIATNHVPNAKGSVLSQYKGMHNSGAKIVAMVLDLE